MPSIYMYICKFHLHLYNIMGTSNMYVVVALLTRRVLSNVHE